MITGFIWFIAYYGSLKISNLFFYINFPYECLKLPLNALNRIYTSLIQPSHAYHNPKALRLHIQSYMLWDLRALSYVYLSYWQIKKQLFRQLADNVNEFLLNIPIENIDINFQGKLIGFGELV